VELAFQEGVIVTQARYLTAEELFLPAPSIRLAISCEFTEPELDRCAAVLHQAMRSVIRRNFGLMAN